MNFLWTLSLNQRLWDFYFILFFLPQWCPGWKWYPWTWSTALFLTISSSSRPHQIGKLLWPECLCPKFVYWNLIPHPVWWYLEERALEVIRSRSGALVHGMRALVRRGWRASSPSSSHGRTQREIATCNSEEGPHRNPVSHAGPDLRLAASRTAGSRFLSVSHQVCGALLQKPRS